MDLLTFPVFLTFFLHFFCASSSSAYTICPISSCSNDSEIPVRFPYRLDHQQPKNCSYPGFDLYCTNQGFTALNLPHSGEFLVRYISYSTQDIRIYDPKSCLPQRFLDGFDPSGTPFQSDLYVNHTFLRCPRNFTDARFPVIECLSNSTTSIIATSHSLFAHEAANKSCQVIDTVPVPISTQQNDDMTSDLGLDVWLSWNDPGCTECELDGGICGFNNNGKLQVGCINDFFSSDDSKNEKGLKIFRIIAFSIAAPAIICAMAVGIFLCIMDKRDAIGANRRPLHPAVTPQPSEASMGLDQATIDSYTKVVLGESRRIPGLNDGSCPICLSDFSAKETLRCIPDCQHCFHADCIDEWLKMNGTCPVCRKSPAHHLQIQSE